MNKYNDRGIIKWMPFNALSGFKEMTSNIVMNDTNVFPDFFDDFLYTFNYEVRESFFNNVKIRIKFLKNGKIYSCESKVINIIEDKNLLILEGNNTIFFQDVIEIQS